MPIWNIVHLREIRNRIRIEAEFYRPEYSDCQKLVESVPHLRLGLARQLITDGTHFTPRYTERGVRFYSAVNVKDGYFAQDGPFKFISEKEHQAIYRRCPVRAGDVLLRKVGVGPRWSCVVPKGLPEFSLFVSVALIRPTEALLPEYLATFMNCRYGQLQLLRLNKGISQPDLHLEDISELVVPLLPNTEQQLIAEYVRQSQTSRDTSRALYQQAQQLLEAELRLDKITFQKPVGYIAQFSEVELPLRIDPEHFFPAFKAFQAGLPAGIELTPLGPLLHFCRRGKQPIYAKAGLPVVNSRHVQPKGVVRDGKRLAVASTDTDFQIQSGDTLLNSTGRGTLGRAAPYLSEERAVPDNHIMILRSAALILFSCLFISTAQQARCRWQCIKEVRPGRLSSTHSTSGSSLYGPPPWNFRRNCVNSMRALQRRTAFPADS